MSTQHFLRVSVSNLIAIKLIFWLRLSGGVIRFYLFLFILLAIKTLTQSNKVAKKKWQGFRNSVSQLLRAHAVSISNVFFTSLCKKWWWCVFCLPYFFRMKIIKLVIFLFVCFPSRQRRIHASRGHCSGQGKKLIYWLFSTYFDKCCIFLESLVAKVGVPSSL